MSAVGIVEHRVPGRGISLAGALSWETRVSKRARDFGGSWSVAQKALLATCLLVAAAAPASGQEASNDDWLSRETLTGDWGGLRRELHDDGIDIYSRYLSESAGNPTGGVAQGVRYAQEINFGATFDMAKLAGIDGGQFQVLLTDRAGRSLSRDKIGNILTVQEIFGSGETLRLTALYYDQRAFSGALDVAVGRLNTENDFAASPFYWGTSLYCNFQSNGICGTPIGMPLNSGYVAYPVASWGSRVKVTPSDAFDFETGAYEVNPSLFDESRSFSFGTSGATGVFVPVQANFHVGRQSGYTGNYALGAYYDTSSVADITTALSRAGPILAGFSAGSTISHTGRYGFYALFDQLVWRDPGSHDAGSGDRGIAVFGGIQIGDRNSATLRPYSELAVVRHGTFAGRDQDSIAFGIADAEFNGRLSNAESALPGTPRQSRELAIELNYGAQVAGWMNVMPGLQYIIHPDGVTSVPNAVVLDLRVSVAF
jgi:porin